MPELPARGSQVHAGVLFLSLPVTAADRLTASEARSAAFELQPARNVPTLLGRPALWQPDLNLTPRPVAPLSPHDAGCCSATPCPGCHTLEHMSSLGAHVQLERPHSAAVQTAQNRSAGCACPKCWRQWSSAATAQPRWRARSPPAQVKYCSRMPLGSQQTCRELLLSSKPPALNTGLVLR